MYTVTGKFLKQPYAIKTVKIITKVNNHIKGKKLFSILFTIISFFSKGYEFVDLTFENQANSLLVLNACQGRYPVVS